MSVYYRRRSPGTRVNLGAGLLALGAATGVAAVTFYLVRLFLAREPLATGVPEGGPEETPTPPGRRASPREG